MITKGMHIEEDKTVITPAENADAWYVVDDAVMGGVSQGCFSAQNSSIAIFSGRVSLENNGGFTSLHHRVEVEGILPSTQIHLNLRGDGKRYQFRVKSQFENRESYNMDIMTDGTWQNLVIPLSNFYPVYRGKRLNLRSFSGKKIEKISFLIANKRAETFRLEIGPIVIGPSIASTKVSNENQAE